MTSTAASAGGEPAQTGSSHRARNLSLAVAAGVVLALVLYVHGAAWWYVPLVLLGIVLAHVLVLGGLFLAVARHSRGGEHAHEQSMLLHRPRQYDRLVRFVLLGREGKLRGWTLDLAELEAGDAVLDVGCGTGTLLVAAAGRVGPSGSLHGIERSPDMLAHARQKAQAQGVAAEIVEGSADNLPYPSETFDAVFCSLVLHHLPEPMQEAAIQEMCRVLGPGGRLVIVEWQQPPSILRALLSPLFLACMMHNLRPGGSVLDRLGIEARLRERGFSEARRHSFGAGGAIGAVAARAYGRVPPVA